MTVCLTSQIIWWGRGLWPIAQPVTWGAMETFWLHFWRLAAHLNTPGHELLMCKWTVSCITLQKLMVSYWPAGNHHSFIHQPTQFLTCICHLWIDLGPCLGVFCRQPLDGAASSYSVVGNYHNHSWNTWILNIYGLHIGFYFSLL